MKYVNILDDFFQTARPLWARGPRHVTNLPRGWAGLAPMSSPPLLSRPAHGNLADSPSFLRETPGISVELECWIFDACWNFDVTAVV